MNYKDLNHNNFKLIFNSCLFDEEWYIKKYFDDFDINFDPIYHFLIEGVYKRFNPNQFFDVEYYLLENDDVKKNGMNPLIHYIKFGKNENRSISSNFNPESLSLEEKLFYESDIYNLEFEKGIKKIHELNLFDHEWYLNQYNDVKLSNVNPLIHYLKIGVNENKNPSPTFDTHFYLLTNPAVREKNLNPLIHYANEGINRGVPTNSYNKFSLLDNDSKFKFLLDKVVNLENSFNKEFDNNKKILDSYHEYFNLIYLNNNVKAQGILRYIQLQTFEMLKFIVKLCEKNEITYWLDYGSLIGAIRHNGYVPWDDEIDIGMLRNDYEKFVKVILNELEKNPFLRDRINLRILFPPFRNLKSINLYPAPTIQFVDKMPLANVDIHVLDYLNVDAYNARKLSENQKFLNLVRKKLTNNIENRNYDILEEEYIRAQQEFGISKNESSLVCYSIDDGFRIPTDISDVFPLKKVFFEGVEFYAPNKPIDYLSKAYYTGDIMKIPKLMHHHNRADYVLKQLKNKDVDYEFNKVLSFWKWINSI